MIFAIPLLLGVSFAAGLLLILFQKHLQAVGRTGALLASSATAILSIAMLAQVLLEPAQVSFEVNSEWMNIVGARWHFGVDAISMWMIALTAVLGFIAILVSKPEAMKPQYYGLILLTGATLFGVFASLDLLAFYIFFELSLIPVAVMILGWGKGNNKAAAMKYLGFLFLGSLPMLLSLAVIVSQTVANGQQAALDLTTLQNLVNRGLWQDAGHLQSLAFWGFMIALLIKSPAVPGHTWIADAYESAPIGAILSGLVIKVGTYGMFRFVLPLFPDASRQFAPIIVTIGVVGIIYGGILACKQDNPFRLMAYSTVSHVGYILVGIFSLNQLGLTGAAFQQVNHGIASGAIIVLLGFLSTRMDVSSLKAIGGLKRTMPVFSTVFLVAMLANLGLPFTSGFIGEILALIGAYQTASAGEFGLNVMMVVVAAGGAILSAVYMLTLYQKLFYGAPSTEAPTTDLTSKEAIIGQGFAFILIVLGVAPMFMLGGLTPAVELVQSAAMRGYKTPIKKTLEPDIINPDADNRNRPSSKRAG